MFSSLPLLTLGRDALADSPTISASFTSHPQKIRHGVLRFELPPLSTIDIKSTPATFFSYNQSVTSGLVSVDGLSFWLEINVGSEIGAYLCSDGPSHCLNYIGIYSADALPGAKIEQKIDEPMTGLERFSIDMTRYIVKTDISAVHFNINYGCSSSRAGFTNIDPMNQLSRGKRLVVEAAFAFVPTACHLLTLGAEHLLASPIMGSFTTNPEKISYGSIQWELPLLNGKESFSVISESDNLVFKKDELSVALKLQINKGKVGAFLCSFGECYQDGSRADFFYYIGIGPKGAEHKNNVSQKDAPVFIDKTKHWVSMAHPAFFDKAKELGLNNIDPENKLPFDRPLVMEAAFAFIPPPKSIRAVRSTALVLSQLPKFVSDAKETKAMTEEIFMSECSPYTKAYLERFRGKPSHSAVVQDLRLSETEFKLLQDEGFLDPTTGKIMNRPVGLHEKIYDLETVLKWNGCNTDSGIKFGSIEVSARRKTVDKFEQTILKIKNDRISRLDVIPTTEFKITKT